MLNRLIRDGLYERLKARRFDDLPSCIQALAIGGSFARGQTDQYSDLDLYIVIYNTGENAVAEASPSIVDWLGANSLWRGPAPLPHFGNSLTLIYSDLSIVQAHLNTLASLEVNPMRATSDIIHDPNGVLQQVVQQAKSLSADLPQLAADCFRLFWIRILFAHNGAQRGELWRAIHYLDDIRGCMFRIERMLAGNFRPGIATEPSASKVEGDLGVTSSTAIEFTITPYSHAGLYQSLLASMRWINERIDFFTSLATIREKDLEIAEMISTEVRAASGL